MRRIRLFPWMGVVALLMGLTACKVKRPDIVLTDEKMEEVLYDFHIVKAMGDELPYNENYKKSLYMEAVYRKHGITQAVFDSSMVWYARYPDALAKVYENVTKRLKRKRDQLNYLIALRGNGPVESLPGDSVDVWLWQRIYQLTGMPLENKLVFTLPSDPHFEERDTLKWNVRFRFIGDVSDSLFIPPLMFMQVCYERDTLSAMASLIASSLETLTLFADTAGSIKSVNGFIYYPEQCGGRDVPLLIDSISLMRYHADSIPDSNLPSPLHE